MLTKSEAKGCEAILKKLGPEDIISLKDTVTNRQIAVEGWREAIKVILSYSETPRSLLKRKKLTRDCLFQYLHDCGVFVSPNLEKNLLIDKILEYWKSDNTTSPSDSFKLEDTDSGSGYSGSYQSNESNEAPSSTISSQEYGDSLSLDENYNCSASAFETNQILQVKGISDNLTKQNESSIVSSEQDQVLAETFVTWFYKMLNSNNPTLNETPQDFGPQHFWNDVRLSVMTNDLNHVDEFEGCDIVCQRFLALMKEELLLFNPNVSFEGVKCQKDPHGLVLISVCGTVHRNNDCLGTFQQMFGIIRDPRFDNNWKIKTSKLGIRSASVQSVPKLEYNCDMLSLTSV